MGKRVFGIDFSSLGLQEAAGRLVTETIPQNEGARIVVTTNLDHVVHLTRNAVFREICSKAWLATADGWPVYLYARLRGSHLPSRVPGPDLFRIMMHGMRPEKHRPFFMVSNMKTGTLLREWLLSQGFDASAVGLACPPFGFEKDEAYSRDLVNQVKAHNATHLVMGVGAPKSELWIYKYQQELGDCYAMGIGAGVDFFVGIEKRAPKWMRRMGMEWLWRFLREPRRLFKRYFISPWRVLIAAYYDLTAQNESAVDWYG
jgi:N-acetylglucosaminyldiphosphoundecaprenol N-acetyl-beta-D-mannosaminyltransferase